MPLDSTGYRNESGTLDKIRKRNDTLPLNQIVREGKACAAAIAKADADTRESTRIAFSGNIAQAGRLWTAAENGVLIGAKIVKLKGPKFVAFAQAINIGRTVAYQMVKLRSARDDVIAWGREIVSVDGRWPTVTAMLQTFGRSTAPRHDAATTGSGTRFEPRAPRYGVPFRNGTDDRPTPRYVFDHLNAVHHFDLDAAADKSNALCARYFSKERDALKQKWVSTAVWLNPPYGRIEQFLKKASEELRGGNAGKVVALLPAWTDTPWFAKYASHGQITFLTGRLKFGGASGTAFFPSMIVVFTAKSGRRADMLSCSLSTIPKP